MATFDELNSELSTASKQRTGRDVDTWLKGYLQGSFRGVTFFTRAATTSGGRRVSIYEYPNKDEVGYEDLGAKKTVFNFSIYIVGGDYFQQREDLITAFEAKGPGKLIHPYRGVFNVIILDFQEAETTEEGRVARFDITAVKYRQVSLTTVTANPQAETFAKKATMLDSILSSFETVYNIAQAPVTIVQDATNAADEILTLVTAAKNIAYTVSDFQREVSNLRGKLTQFILTAENIGKRLISIVDFGTDEDSATAENSTEQLDELQRINEGLYQNNTKTPDDIYFSPDNPANTINDLVAQVIVASSLGLVTTANYETVEQALDVQANFFPLLDSILDNANTSDEVYAAARDAKAAAVEHLEQTILDLSRVIEYPVPQTATVLRLCNELYGTTTEELQDDLLERNEIENPMFITRSVKAVVGE